MLVQNPFNPQSQLPAGGFVSSVTANTASLTISPTTGAVLAEINHGFANEWLTKQTMLTTSPLYFNNSTGTNTGKLSWDSAGSGTFDISTYNVTGAKTTAPSWIRFNAMNANSFGVTPSAGGGFQFLSGAGTFGARGGYLRVGSGTPLFSTAMDSIYADGDLEIFQNVYFPGIGDGLLKNTSGTVSPATAGTDYEVPLTFSTGLTRTVNTVTVNTTQNISRLSNLTTNGFVKTSGSNGTLSVDTTAYGTGSVTSIATTSPILGGTITTTGTISFDVTAAFTGSLTWTGAHLFKNASNSTAAFQIQDSSGNIRLIADTTNGSIGINAAATAGAVLTIANATTAQTRSVNSAITLSAKQIWQGITSAPILAWTGTGSSSLNQLGAQFVTIVDQRVITGSNDFAFGLITNASRQSAFHYSTTGIATYFGLQNVVTDAGNYDGSSGTIVAGATQQSHSVNGLTINSTGTYTASFYGNKISLLGTPVRSAGTFNATYYGVSVAAAGNTVGTSLFFGYYLSNSAAYGTGWAFWNDTTLSNFLGGDNSKTYFGTGTNTLGSATGAIGDASIYYDATNLIINPQEIGTGYLSILGKIGNYNNVVTTGWGVPTIYGTGRSTGQVAAVASVATYTVGAADGSFEVSANVLITTATLFNFVVQVTYTDEGNTARTETFNFSTIGGVIGVALTNATGAVPYEGIPLHIRCKASTAITIKTANGGGTNFTTVVYNCEGIIKQTA